MVVSVLAQEAVAPWTKYLADRTAVIASDSREQLAQVTAADWPATEKLWRGQLQEMLGLMPWPERTDLATKITGTLERDGYRVTKLSFQSRPGLYVAANLYEPAAQAQQVVGQLSCMFAGMPTFVTRLGCRQQDQLSTSWYLVRAA